PRTTRAPLRGTSGTRRSRSRAGSAGPRRGPAPVLPGPTGTSRPDSRRAAAGTATSRARAGSLAKTPSTFDEQRHPERDPERGAQGSQGVLVEEGPAEVPEPRAVDRPAGRRQRVERREPQVRIVRQSRRQGHGGPAARHVPADDDDQPAPHRKLVLGPAEGFLGAVPAEESLLRRTPDEPPEGVRDVVPGEGPGRARHDYPAELQVSQSREEPGHDQA